jgi:hypothetical protein
VPVILFDFKRTLTFSTDLQPPVQNVTKIRPVVAELFRVTDGQMDEGDSRFSQLRELKSLPRQNSADHSPSCGII